MEAPPATMKTGESCVTFWPTPVLWPLRSLMTFVDVFALSYLLLATLHLIQGQEVQLPEGRLHRRGLPDHQEVSLLHQMRHLQPVSENNECFTSPLVARICVLAFVIRSSRFVKNKRPLHVVLFARSCTIQQYRVGCTYTRLCGVGNLLRGVRTSRRFSKDQRHRAPVHI